MGTSSIVTEEFEFIDPISDFGFKKIFGNERSREVLISFLNELLKGKKKITELSFIKDVQPEYLSDRSILIDLHCVGDDGQHFIIEMQRVNHINFRERCVAYTSRIISNQTGKGKDYQYDLKEVIFIGILNFNFKQAIGEGHINEICLKNKHTNEIFYEKPDYIFVELPEFNKTLDNCTSAIDKWIYLFRNLNAMKKIPKALNQGVFKKVFEIADLNKLTPDERMVYDLKMFHKENLKNADLFQFQEGKEEGMEEGKIQGIEIGTRKNTRELAAEMKLEGIPLPTIAKITKLSSTEIENL